MAEKLKNKWAATGAFSLALAIILGAWNAHSMEKLVASGDISEKYLKTFHTGVEYHIYGSLGILLLSLYQHLHLLKLNLVFWMLLTGLFLFSFSLYFLSFHEMLGPGFKMLGAVTPFGGLLMIAAWVYAAIILWKGKVS